MTKLYYDAGTWTVPGQQGRGATRCDVPNNPAELANWLNSRALKPHTPVSAAQSTSAEAELDADAVCEWILDRATPAQVEHLFAVLGTRFHELRRLVDRDRARSAAAESDFDEAYERCPSSPDGVHDFPRDIEEHERSLCTWCDADGDG